MGNRVPVESLISLKKIYMTPNYTSAKSNEKMVDNAVAIKGSISRGDCEF